MHPCQSELWAATSRLPAGSCVQRTQWQGGRLGEEAVGRVLWEGAALWERKPRGWGSGGHRGEEKLAETALAVGVGDGTLHVGGAVNERRMRPLCTQPRRPCL